MNTIFTGGQPVLVSIDPTMQMRSQYRQLARACLQTIQIQLRHGWIPRMLLLLLCGVPQSGHAARISEPGTTFYGRVISRAGDREFPITTGELKWTLGSASQPGREYTLTAALKPIEGGQYSYMLTVPHQALAYDLTVSANSLPLTAAGWRFRHIKVLINGEEATLSAPATDDFSARQSTRATAYRIDLVLSKSALDSDGDGLPDWWEDQNGTDKWNPNDANVATGGSGGSNQAASYTGRTFAEWRKHFFPHSAGPIDAFAQEDPDHDGISNFLEYAFDLDAQKADGTQGAQLPRAQKVENRAGISYQRRVNASDLNFQVEYSQDLVQWRSDAESLEEVSLTDATPGQTCVCTRSTAESGAPVFLRVRVGFKQ